MKDIQLHISIQASIYGDTILCPSFELPLLSNKIIGINSDVYQSDYIMKQMQHHSEINLFFRIEGQYDRLTVL